MKSEEAREFVRTMEKEYNAHNKMINSTVAHQAVRMAEIELTQKQYLLLTLLVLTVGSSVLVWIAVLERNLSRT